MKTVIEMALEALERMKRYGNTFGYRSHEQNPYEQVCEAITALREALAEQPAQQEPVAWVCYGSNNKLDIDFFEDDIADLAVGTKLYTPAQRTWVGLTDEEANKIYKDGSTFGEMMRMVEAKLKEKNNG